MSKIKSMKKNNKIERYKNKRETLAPAWQNGTEEEELMPKVIHSGLSGDTPPVTTPSAKPVGKCLAAAGEWNHTFFGIRTTPWAQPLLKIGKQAPHLQKNYHT